MAGLDSYFTPYPISDLNDDSNNNAAPANPAPQPVAQPETVATAPVANQNLHSYFQPYDKQNAPVAAPQSMPQSSQQIPAWQAMLRHILPSPSIPFGLNVTSGLLSAGAKGAEKNALQNLPQMMTGQQPTFATNAANQIGSAIPSLMTGAESIPGQSLVAGIMGAAGAPPGQRMHEASINALTALGIGKVLPLVNTLLGNSGVKETANAIQANHDAMMQQAQNAFQTVSKGVNDRGITQVPFDKSIIKQARDYFPQTTAARNLLNDAKSGDYNSLRDLQSEMWQRGTASKGSDLISEQNKGEELLDLRDKLNQSISDHLINTGNEDLNNVLNHGRNTYYNLQKTFYSHPTISKLVDEDVRKVPKNLMTVIQEDSKPMNAFRQANPQVQENINTLHARNALASLGKGLGIGGGALAGGATLYHYLFPEHPTVNAPVQNP